MYNLYFIKAIDSYPWDLEQTVEALDYALSYDSENPLAHVLQGRIYAEKFGEYELAIECYEEAMALEPECRLIYPYFIQVLLTLKKWDQAMKLLTFAKSLGGFDCVYYVGIEAKILLGKGQWKQAKTVLQEGKFLAQNAQEEEYLRAMIQRIKKLYQSKKKKKKNKKKKGKK